jgi:hypothetical protein
VTARETDKAEAAASTARASTAVLPAAMVIRTDANRPAGDALGNEGLLIDKGPWKCTQLDVFQVLSSFKWKR